MEVIRPNLWEIRGKSSVTDLRFYVKQILLQMRLDSHPPLSALSLAENSEWVCFRCQPVWYRTELVRTLTVMSVVAAVARLQ
jgi:hypothetical protein